LTGGVLNVTKATPILMINLPTMVLMPGNFNLSGRLESELGPLQQALITINLGNAKAEVRSADDGTFATDMKMGTRLDLIGSEALGINVSPQEPWNDTLTITRKVLLVNVINCGIFLVIVAVFGILVSRRLRMQFQAYGRRRAMAQQSVMTITFQEPVPVYSEAITTPVVPDQVTEVKGDKVEELKGEPRIRVFSWYILVLRLAQRVARVMLKPQHTLREFVRETQKTLGPIAGYLLEFTKIVERLLYSKHQVSERDVESSQQLTRQIQAGFKNENP
jgi:hypothetical protein